MLLRVVWVRLAEDRCYREAWVVASHQMYCNHSNVSLWYAIDFVEKYLKISESTTMECMKNFAAGIIRVLREEYLWRPTKLILIICCRWRKPVISLVYSKALIACTGNGRTIHWFGKIPLQNVYTESPQSFLRRLHRMTIGYGMPFLDAREP